MFRTVIGKSHRRTLIADRVALLQAAESGDAEAVGQLCDRHGAALISLARAVVGDPALAESVVVDVVARACADPIATADVSGSLRRELARLTYLSAIRCSDDAAAPTEQLARMQRSAVALVQCGDHTLDDVVD